MVPRNAGRVRFRFARVPRASRLDAGGPEPRAVTAAAAADGSVRWRSRDGDEVAEHTLPSASPAPGPMIATLPIGCASNTRALVVPSMLASGSSGPTSSGSIER